MNIRHLKRPGVLSRRVSLFIRSVIATTLLMSFLTLTVGAEEEEYVERVFLTKKQALKLAFPGVKKVKKKKVWLSDAQTAAIQKILGDQIKYNERRVTHS
jgi:hypothetical protein